MTRKSIVSSSSEQFLQLAMNDMCEALKEEFFEVSGTPTVTVKYKDGSFRKKPIAGILFALDYVYISAGKKLIFGFTPEDAQPWLSAEIPYENLDTIFPNLLTTIKKVIFDGDESVDDATWTEIITILVEAREQKTIQEEKEAKARSEAQYANNSNYARF